MKADSIAEQAIDPVSELPKVDRRIQRTRQLLRDALMALIVARGEWDSITIQDITDQANVSRTTFYLHYRDKEELLFTSMEEIYEDLLARYQPVTMEGFHTPEAIDFEHVAEYAQFYVVMLGPKGSAAFVDRLHTYLSTIIRDRILKPLTAYKQSPATVSLDPIAHFLAGAELGLIRWWLATGMRQTPLHMTKVVDELCVRGTLEALGLPRPPDWAPLSPLSEV